MKKRLLLFSIAVSLYTALIATPGYKSTLSRVYSSPFVEEQLQYNQSGIQGTLYDGFGTDGSLSINDQLNGSQAKAIQVLADGSFVVALSQSSSDSVIAKYTPQGSVANFGSAGVCGLGSSTAVAQAMMIDSQGRILVAGGASSGTSGWIVRAAADGTSVTPFVTGTAWQYIAGLAQQSSGNIIAVGFNGTNAQIARYGIDGTLDTTFGSLGYFVCNGVAGRPTSTNGLFDVVIDGDNNIYVLFLSGTSAKVAKLNSNGSLVAGFGVNGIASVSYLNSATASQMRIAIDYYTQLIVGAQVSGNVKVASLQQGDGSAGSLANFSTSIFTSLYDIVPTNDGKVLLLGSNTSTIQMAVARLTSSGLLDTDYTHNTPFNGTFGYNLFSIASPTINSIITAGAIAPNGLLYAAGYQTTGVGSTTTPYISVLYDAPYVALVTQYPSVLQQGILSPYFGDVSKQSVPGVLMPYNGYFNAALQQKARAFIEISSGDLLLGYDGYTDSSATSSLMLAWLTPSGDFDNTYGPASNGKLTLNQQGTLTGIANSGSGTIYVTSNNTTPNPVLASYTSTSTSSWSSGNYAWQIIDTGIASVGIALQGTLGILLFCQDSGSTGHISRYTQDGNLDLTFGPDGIGKIISTDFGLRMGAIYGGGLVDSELENIYIVYQNSITNFINIALINKNGTDLVSDFGPDNTGIVQNIFNSDLLTASKVRCAFGANGTIIVAAVDETNQNYAVVRYNAITGMFDSSFNNGDILYFSPTESLVNLSLTNIVGISDGSIVLTGYNQATDPVMFTIRIAQDGSLDNTFNPEGSIPGVLPLQIEDEVANYYTRDLAGIAVQTSSGYQGNIVLAAYEQQAANLSTPEVMRVYGQPGTYAIQRYPSEDQYPGTLDLALNNCGAISIQSITDLGTARVVYAYPDGNDYQGMILLGVDTGSDLFLTRVNQVSLEQDPDFGFDGVVSISGYTGLKNIFVDNKNQIILCGTKDDQAWAFQTSENANAESDPVLFDIPSSVSYVSAIYQQKSGRYILIGAASGQGIVVAFQNEAVAPATTLAVDASFNPLATNSVYAGSIGIANASVISDLAINYDDTLLLAYGGTTSLSVEVAKLYANGSGLDGSFSSSGVLITEIGYNTPITNFVTLNDNSLSTSKIVIAASTSTGLSIIRYNYDGSGDSSWNSTGNPLNITGVGSLSVSLTSLLVTEENQSILTGFSDIGGSNGTLFAVRVSDSGVLDTTWNPYPVSPDVPGILTFGGSGNPLTPAITSLYQSYVSIQGNVFAVGGNGEEPILMEIVGNSYVNEVPQGQIPGAAGTLDLTLLEPTGALEVESLFTGPLGAMTDMYINQDGYIYFASNYTGSQTFVSKMLPTLQPDPSFNPTYGSIVSIPNAEICYDLFVADAQGLDGSIYVTGSNAGQLWASQINATGDSVFSYEFPVSMAGWTAGYAIRRAYNGDVVIAGFDGTYGAVAAMLPDANELDTAFGVNGVYTTTSTNPIAAMTIDNQARIYIAYKDSASSNLFVQRLLSDGTLDDSFNLVDTILSCNSTQISMALDVAHNHLVVADYYENSIIVTRLSTLNGSTVGSAVVAIPSKTLNLSNVVINSGQQIYVIGTNITDSQAVVARLNSVNPTAITLDTTYGDNGIATIAIAPSISFTAGQLDPDSRIYVIGNDNSSPANGYLSRFFGDNYYTQVSQSQVMPRFILGEFDHTYGDEGSIQTYAGGATSNQLVRSILPLQAGVKLISSVQDSDGLASWTVRMLSDGTNDSTYGDGQGLSIAQASTGVENINNMIINGNGIMFVVGSNSTQGGFVKSILPTGLMNPDFGGLSVEGSVYFAEIDTINAIAQLSSGLYVVAGQKSGAGIIGMLYQSGAIYRNFGSNGFITTGLNVMSLSVDSSDNIYAAVATEGAETYNASVIKLSALGQYVTSYGTNGSVTVINDIYSTNDLQAALDVNGLVVIAAGLNNISATIELARLTTDGIVDETFGTSGYFAINLDEPYIPYVSSITPLMNGNILVAGFEQLVTMSHTRTSADNNAYQYVASVTTDGIYDVNFNPYSTPGINVFQVESIEESNRYIWNMSVQHDGQILLSGSDMDASNITTPLTMRLNGYIGIQAVPQFPGYVTPTPSPINPNFGDNGFAYTGVITNILDGGPTVVDIQNRVLIAGITSAPSLVVARFLTDGTLDTDFNGTGIAESPIIETLSTGSYLAIDAFDRVYVAGITSDGMTPSTNQLVVVRFLEDGSLDSEGFNPLGSPAGVAISNSIENLTIGGYLAFDYAGRILLGGMTSDHALVAARFAEDGSIDNDFGTLGIASTDAITSLSDGGYIAAAAHSSLLDDDGSVYVGGAIRAGSLVVAKFDVDGNLVAGFGTDGIASSGDIEGLLEGGSLGLDSSRKIAVGGFVINQQFIAAMFDTDGVLVPGFGQDGIAYTDAIIGLTSFANLWIDSNENIVLGGLGTDIDNTLHSMIVGRFTPTGSIDRSLSTTGVVTTGNVTGLSSGGFVSTNMLNQIYAGGFVGDQLVIAGLYAGDEIVINNPLALPSEAFLLYNYGNSPEMFKKFFAIDWYAQVIQNNVARIACIAQVNSSLDDYAGIYTGQQDFILAPSAYPAWNHKLLLVAEALKAAYTSSETDIDTFFTNLLNRMQEISAQMYVFNDRR